MLKPPAYGSRPSEPKLPASIPDRLAGAPRIEIPIDFNLYPQAIPSIGPNGDNTVPAKPGATKYPMQSAPSPRAKPNAGFLREQGLG